MAKQKKIDDSEKALKAEHEWRQRLILAARKMQLASQSFSKDLTAVRDVRPEMNRLEQALRASHDKLEGLEDRLLAEIMRRLEEKSGHAAAIEANAELVSARTELQSRSDECERLTAEVRQLSAKIEADASTQQEVGEATASKQALLNQLDGEIDGLHGANDRMREQVVQKVSALDDEGQQRILELQSLIETIRAEHEEGLKTLRSANEKEMSTLRDRLRLAELEQSEIAAKHQTELTDLADHSQGRIRRLEEEVSKKRRGLKALTEENIQLQIQLNQARQQLEEHENEIAALEAQADEPDTRAAIERATAAEPRGALPRKEVDEANRLVD